MIVISHCSDSDGLKWVAIDSRSADSGAENLVTWNTISVEKAMSYA